MQVFVTTHFFSEAWKPAGFGPPIAYFQWYRVLQEEPHGNGRLQL